MLFDPEVPRALVAGTPDWISLILLCISFIGSLYLLVPLCFFLAYRGTSHRERLWWLGLPGGYVIVGSLKYLLNRPRPAVAPPEILETSHWLVGPLVDLAVQPSTPAFPSGHAFTATVLCGALMVELETGSRRLRALVAAVLVLLVGFSRVAHGVHYPGDVAAGMILGGLYLEGMIRLKA